MKDILIYVWITLPLLVLGAGEYLIIQNIDYTLGGILFTVGAVSEVIVLEVINK